MHSRRAYTRVSFSDPVRVYLPSRETVISTLASNLSRGGIFLRLDRPFPKGQTLSLEFNTYRGPVMINQGEVTWTKIRPPESNGVSAVPGMGIRFLKMSEEARIRIGHFVDERIRRQQFRIENKRTTYTDTVEDRNEARRLSSAYIIVSSSVKEATPRPVEEKPTPAPATWATPFPVTKLLLILNVVVAALIVVALATLLLLKPATPDTQTAAVEVFHKEHSASTKERPAIRAETISVEPAAPTHKDDTPRVGPPVFAETSGGWYVTVQASAPANIYHFTQEDPPTLILLFRKTTYTGEHHQIEPQMPQVAGVRVQDQLGYTRFIFEFTGRTIPEHTVITGEDSAQVVFSTDISQ